MSERLPRNTHPAYHAGREAGARAIAAAIPPAPTVSDRAARLPVAAPPIVPPTPRGPIGPSGTGPSIDQMRESLEADIRTLAREALDWWAAGSPTPPERTPRRRPVKRPSPQLRLPGLDDATGPYRGGGS